MSLPIRAVASSDRPSPLPRAVFILDVVESAGANEESDISVPDVEFAGELEGVADDAAIVVEIAVVVVGLGDLHLVALRNTKRHAVGKGRVQTGL